MAIDAAPLQARNFDGSKTLKQVYFPVGSLDFEKISC